MDTACVAGLEASQGCPGSRPPRMVYRPRLTQSLRFAKCDPFFNSSRVTVTPLEAPM